MAFSENGTVLEEELDPYGLLSHFDMNIVIGIQSALLLLGVTGNTLILYLFGKRRERPTYVIAVLALAVKDLVACCIYLPFSIALEARGFVTSSNFVCKSYHFLSNLTFNFTMPSLLLIALDRCVCVWRGHAQASNTRRVFIAIGVLGVFSLSVSIVQSLAFRVNEGYCGFSVSRTSLEHLRLFEKIMVFAFQTDAIVSILVYFAIFGTVFFYQKYTSNQHVAYSQLYEMGGRRGRDTESSSLNVTESTTSGDLENTTARRTQLLQLQKDQIPQTGVMFAFTLLYTIECFPALLSSFTHVRHTNIPIFLLFQIRFVSNCFVYLCFDASFRKDFKDLCKPTSCRIH